MEAPHVYVRAWTLCCVLLILLWECANKVGGQLREDKECPFSGVINSGRIWGKVPESDALSVGESVSRLENK